MNIKFLLLLILTTNFLNSSDLNEPPRKKQKITQDEINTFTRRHALITKAIKRACNVFDDWNGSEVINLIQDPDEILYEAETDDHVPIISYVLMHDVVGLALEKIINYLIKQGAALEMTNKDGETVIVVAIKNHKSKDIVKSLIEAGSDCLVKDRDGRNLVELATDVLDKIERHQIPVNSMCLGLEIYSLKQIIAMLEKKIPRDTIIKFFSDKFSRPLTLLVLEFID